MFRNWIQHLQYAKLPNGLLWEGGNSWNQVDMLPLYYRMVPKFGTTRGCPETHHPKNIKKILWRKNCRQSPTERPHTQPSLSSPPQWGSLILCQVAPLPLLPQTLLQGCRVSGLEPKTLASSQGLWAFLDPNSIEQSRALWAPPPDLTSIPDSMSDKMSDRLSEWDVRTYVRYDVRPNATCHTRCQIERQTKRSDKISEHVSDRMSRKTQMELIECHPVKCHTIFNMIVNLSDGRDHPK